MHGREEVGLLDCAGWGVLSGANRLGVCCLVKPPLEICFVGLIWGKNRLDFRTWCIYSGVLTAHYKFPTMDSQDVM